MPVLAVTETTSGLDACFFFNAIMMALRSKDFPVPAQNNANQCQCATNSPWHEQGNERKCAGAYLPSQ